MPAAPRAAIRRLKVRSAGGIPTIISAESMPNGRALNSLATGIAGVGVLDFLEVGFAKLQELLIGFAR